MSTTISNSASNKDLLRLLTCGSVDDGKSTLIGRLLLETGNVPDDVLDKLKKDSATSGTQGNNIDPALLTDGLKAEREQGITIDVAHIYFGTQHRSFIIADTPGHEQYTRNMVTGASMSSVAIILIDAKKGVVEQTRRHAFIASLLGIKHVIVAVNKMDVVAYSQSRYDVIQTEFTNFASKLEIVDLHFVPISALVGDNVASHGSNMPWYNGTTLLSLLETVHIASDRNLVDFRFPVQYVSRPNSDYRGYCGTIASGSVRPGDTVMILPSKKTTKISAIDTFNGNKDVAYADEAVTILLEDEIDISRGDMIVPPKNLPHIASSCEAMIVWMNEAVMDSAKNYVFKFSTKEVSGTFDTIRYQLDVQTLRRKNSNALDVNDIGRCKVSFDQPVVFDAYRRNKATGAFIVIDRETNETVAAGMVLERSVDDQQEDKKEYKVLTKEHSHISKDERIKKNGYTPTTILLTGMCGVGKSTIAYALERLLFEKDISVSVLDGENLRLTISQDLGFGESARFEQLRRAGHIAKILNDSGSHCICALVSPTVESREVLQEIVGAKYCKIVHLTAPIDVCRSRDREELYANAEQGNANVPGVSSAYEVPNNADLTIDTSITSAEEATAKILELL